MKQQLASLKLSVAELNAFRVVARERSFTLAAGLLHTSQPTLSRRIRVLEDKLQVCLFARGGGGIALTESGRKLLRHVDSACLHEAELIAELRGLHPHSLHGLLRIGGPSSLLRAVAVPAIAPLLRANAGTLVELVGAEGIRADRLLPEGRADLVLSGTSVPRRGHAAVRLGTQMHVLLESSSFRERDAVFLDQGIADDGAERLLAGAALPMRHGVVGDAHTVLRAVELGLGRALVPVHLVEAGAAVRRVDDSMACATDCYVHHAREARHARLIQAAVECLVAGAPDLLARDAAGLLPAQGR